MADEAEGLISTRPSAAIATPFSKALVMSFWVPFPSGSMTDTLKTAPFQGRKTRAPP